MNKVQAYHNFWSSFGLIAYDENTVPDDAVTVNNGKYITYEFSSDFFGISASLTVSLWYKSYSWEEITAKAKEIADEITRGGKIIHCDEGAIWISRGSPWAMRMPDSASDGVRRIILNVEVEFLD